MLTKIFISSVQREFAEERRRLVDYIRQDVLFGQFFEPFIFENLPAGNQNAQQAYLHEVAKCDIYLGLFGVEYGYEDAEGLSPTEREYDTATANYRYRLAYVKQADKRNPKEAALIEKVEQDVVRRTFTDFDSLRAFVYASLIRYLKEKDIIHSFPFDASGHPTAQLSDLDAEKVRVFVERARKMRSFPLTMENGLEAILSGLHLFTADGHLTNSALLLFAKNPQAFFRPSEVKCVQFYGTKVQKPAPFYQVFYGNIFELVDQAKAFVMSHIDARIGDHSTADNVKYELPESAVHEAIVNAIVHRDYTRNSSVQVMLFQDRLEVRNPGQLPIGLTPAKLTGKHSSEPTNPILAHPVYLAGYIERLGTGTNDLIDACLAAGLKRPTFIQEEDFCITLWRNPEFAAGNGFVEAESNDLVKDTIKSYKTIEGSTKGAEKDPEKDLEKDLEKFLLTLSKNQYEIVKRMSVNNLVSMRELGEIIGINERNVRKNIDKLKSLGVIERIGPDKGGYWKVNLKR